MYAAVRPLLFQLDAEQAHALTLRALQLAGAVPPARRLLARLFTVRDPRLEVTVAGLRFRNPVGLAAGYDKNGAALRGLAALGFGHIEAGTVTRLPQAGNPRPRVHRLPEARALVNSMGFPNAGIAALPDGLARSTHRAVPGPVPVRLGLNLGKGKDTPLEQAAEDYCLLLEHAHAHGQADYAAINVSSPNTLGLRQLQARAAMEALLGAIARTRDGLAPRLPVFVKIAPDLTEPEIDDVLAAVARSGVDGVIVTNTTTLRAGVPAAERLPGGLSGAPLRERALAAAGYIARQTGGRLPLIGVGGIASAAGALDMLGAGAQLVQVYTGLVYTGPWLIRAINQGLVRACAAAGLHHVSELSGRAIPARSEA